MEADPGHPRPQIAAGALELMTERRDIIIDRDRCIGTGNCVFYAEQTFDLDEENKAFLIDALGDDEGRQRMAVENCPTGALSFAEGDSPAENMG